jgi:hypothetical protein
VPAVNPPRAEQRARRLPLPWDRIALTSFLVNGTDPQPAGAPHQELALRDAIDFALAEARMVLPGVQAIFGFQLIVTFNDRFASALTPLQQILHLVALVLTGVSMALVMTPAAYHRSAQRESVSTRLLEITSRFISSAMIVLAAGLAIDLYLVTFLVTGSSIAAVAVALGMLALFVALWIVYPRVARR